MTRYTVLTAHNDGPPIGEIRIECEVPPIRYSRKSHMRWLAAVSQACQQLEAQTGVPRNSIIVEWCDGGGWHSIQSANVVLD